MIYVPEFSGNRIIKIHHKDRWEKLVRTFCKQKDFDYIENSKRHPFKETDVFYSVSSFLDQEHVREKMDNAIILSSDLVFDVDAYKLSEAKFQAQCIYYMMRFHTDDYQLKYIAFSGNKGYHLVYKDLKLPPISTRKRLAYYTNRKLEIVNKLRKMGIEWDHDVTLDVWRVIRLPGTWNTKSGKKCEIITTDELLRTEMPSKKSDGINKKARRANDDHPAHELTGKARAVLSAEPYPYISNKVSGTNLRIPILKFVWTLPLDRLKKLQKAYRLGTLYLFSNGTMKYVVSLKPVEPERLHKIQYAAQCMNRHNKTTYFPATELKSEQPFVIEDSCDFQRSKAHSVLISIIANQEIPVGTIGTCKLQIVRPPK